MIEPGAREAWGTLTTKLRPFIARRTATETDADDVLQDVFVRIHEGLPALRDGDRFGPWVYRVAKNAIVDHGRRLARQPFVNAVGDEAESTAEERGADLKEELASCVAPFIALLASPYREVLTLTELEGLTHQRAAEMLGISLTATKSRVQRGRAKLREVFDACCEIELDARGRVMACSPRENPVLPGCKCGG